MCYLFISKCADSHSWSTWKSQPGMAPSAVNSTQIVRVTLCPRGFALWFSRDFTARGMGKWHWKNHQQDNTLKMEAGINFTMEFCRAVLKTLSYIWTSYLSLMATSFCLLATLPNDKYRKILSKSPSELLWNWFETM